VAGYTCSPCEELGLADNPYEPNGCRALRHPCWRLTPLQCDPLRRRQCNAPGVQCPHCPHSFVCSASTSAAVAHSSSYPPPRGECPLRGVCTAATCGPGRTSPLSYTYVFGDPERNCMDLGILPLVSIVDLRFRSWGLSSSEFELSIASSCPPPATGFFQAIDPPVPSAGGGPGCGRRTSGAHPHLASASVCHREEHGPRRTRLALKLSCRFLRYIRPTLGAVIRS
jgi:hypothetical protein